MSEPAVRYPLPCGCAGPKYLSLCDEHKLAAMNRHRRLMGMTEPPHCPTCTCEKKS